MPNNKKSANPTSGWGAIFDVDGTMVDNAQYHQQGWLELGRRYDLSITPEYYRKYIHARSNDKNVRTLFGEDTSDEMVQKISDEKENIYRDNFRPVLKEIPGLTDLLKTLRQQNIACAAASNSPKENVDMVLDELDIRKYFEVVINRDQVTVGKPNPEILLTVAAKLGLQPDKCVVFEDSSSGFKAAENAKMPYIVITTGADEEELKQATTPAAIHKDFTTITPADLKALITSHT